jgi:hypothetical protein
LRIVHADRVHSILISASFSCLVHSSTAVPQTLTSIILQSRLSTILPFKFQALSNAAVILLQKSLVSARSSDLVPCHLRCNVEDVRCRVYGAGLDDGTRARELRLVLMEWPSTVQHCCAFGLVESESDLDPLESAWIVPAPVYPRRRLHSFWSARWRVISSPAPLCSCDGKHERKWVHQSALGYIRGDSPLTDFVAYSTFPDNLNRPFNARLHFQIPCN